MPPVAFDAIGLRVIDSTPQAIARSYAPHMTPCAAKCIGLLRAAALAVDARGRTDWGRPAATHALRVTLQPCSPTWVTLPPTTSSIRSGSTPVRDEQALQGVAEQIGRVPAGQRAVALADRRADGVDDDRFAELHAREAT